MTCSGLKSLHCNELYQNHLTGQPATRNAREIPKSTCRITPWFSVLGCHTSDFPRFMDQRNRLGEGKLKDFRMRALLFQFWCFLVGEAKSASHLASIWMSTPSRWNAATSLQAKVQVSWHLKLSKLCGSFERTQTYKYKSMSRSEYIIWMRKGIIVNFKF